MVSWQAWCVCFLSLSPSPSLSLSQPACPFFISPLVYPDFKNNSPKGVFRPAAASHRPALVLVLLLLGSPNSPLALISTIKYPGTHLCIPVVIATYIRLLFSVPCNTARVLSLRQPEEPRPGLPHSPEQCVRWFGRRACGGRGLFWERPAEV